MRKGSLPLIVKSLFRKHLQLEVANISITKSSSNYISDSAVQAFNEAICNFFEKVVKNVRPPVR